MKGVTVLLLLLLSFVSLSLSATVTFQYDPQGTASFDWDDTDSWDTGSVPTASDDVVLNGASSGGGGWQVIAMPSSAVSVNSLSLSGADISLSFGDNIVMTIGTLHIDTSGGNFTAMTSATVVVTTSFTTDIDGSNTAWENMIFNVTGTTSYQGSFETVTTNTVFNNFGTWTLSVYTEDDGIGDGAGSFTFNNYKNVIVAIAPSADEGPYNTYVGATFNNLAGSNVTINKGVTMAIGPQQPGDTVNCYFNNWGNVAIAGALLLTGPANGTFYQGSSVSGTGVINFWGQCSSNPRPVLTLNQDFNIYSMNLAGCVHIYSNNHALNLTRLDWNGGTITGTGPVTIYNLTHVGTGDDFNPDGDIYLIGRNLTITNYWGIAFSQGIIYLESAFIINAPKSSNHYIYTTLIKQPDGISTTCGWVDYSYTTEEQFTFSYVSPYVPHYIYGTIYYPENWDGVPGETGTGEPVEYQAAGGGAVGGNITATFDIIGGYNSDSIDWICGFANGPFQILPTAHFHGGVTSFGGYLCEDFDWTAVGCWVQNQYHWQGRAAGDNVGDGIIAQDQGGIFAIDGPNVVFQNYWALDGLIYGDYNMTVINGIFSIDPDTSPHWTINGTNFIIASGGWFNFSDSGFYLINSAKIIVEKGAILYVAEGLDDNGEDDSDTGVYVYGSMIFTPTEQDMTYTFSTKTYLYNDTYVNSIYTTSDEPIGDTLRFENTMENHGTIHLHVYSATQSDMVLFYAYNYACTFMGTYDLHFGYTAKANDQILIVEVDSAYTCGGLFNVTSSNLGSGLSLRILYDQQDPQAEANYHFAVVCANTNSSCLSLTRNPMFLPATTQETTSTSSSSSGTTHAGTTATTQSSGTTTATTHSSTTLSPTTDNGSTTNTTGDVSSSAGSLAVFALFSVSMVVLSVAL